MLTHVLSNRNGSLRNPKGGGIRLNGLHDEDQWEEQSSTSGRAKKSTLTNGHIHPSNGALKLTDMSLGSGGLTQAAQTEQRDSMGMVSPMAHPYDGSRTPSPIPPHQPRISPAPPHKHDSDLLNGQCQVTPPTTPTNQHASTLSNLSLAKPHPPDQGSRRVRLNGSHHSSSGNGGGPSHNHSHHDLSEQSGKPAARAAEGGIISEFYSYSRLHHISTWRSEFAEYVNSLQCRRRATGGAMFSGKEKLKRLRAQRSSGGSAGGTFQLSGLFSVYFRGR